MNQDRIPEVSVYLPTHERPALLVRAAASVLAQSFTDFELIIVDDGSRDETAAVLGDLARRDRRIVTHRISEPGGAPRARNTALGLARGRFVTGLDDDDEFLPFRLAQLRAAHRDTYSFVCSRDLVSDGKSRTVQTPDHGVIGLDALLHGNRVGNQIFARRERVLALGGFDPELPALQDYDLWVRMVERFGPCLRLQEPSQVIHTSGTDRISGVSERRLTALRLFRAKHEARMRPEHRQSMDLLQLKFEGRAPSLSELSRVMNRHNWRSGVALAVNARLGGVAGLVRRARTRS